MSLGLVIQNLGEGLVCGGSVWGVGERLGQCETLTYMTIIDYKYKREFLVVSYVVKHFNYILQYTRSKKLLQVSVPLLTPNLEILELCSKNKT